MFIRPGNVSVPDFLFGRRADLLQTAPPRIFMKKIFFLILFWGNALCAFAQAGAESPENFVPAESVFNAKNAAVLGVVEGLTEYLPVSSTGHLILTNAALGLDSDAAIDVRGNSDEIVKNRDGSVFTVKEAADAYSIIIQFGAIIAVFFAYWKRCTGTLVGVLCGDAASWRLSRNLIVAFVPAAGLGFLFSDKIETYLFNPVTVAIALVVGGVLMLVVDLRQKKRVATLGGNADEQGPDLQELSVKQSLTIGAMQCIALWPGMSRSMATIVGGYVAGLSPRRATEFSFLLGLITLSAASIYKTLKCARQMAESFGAEVSVVGLVVAFIAAFVSVKWMVDWISKHGLAAFAWYRFALAAVVLVWAAVA